MINGNVNEFIDNLSCGEELIFIYGKQKFFLQGYKENGKFTLFLDRWEPPSDDYVWIGVGDEKHYPVEKFLSAKLWDGRDFWSAESEIEWTD